MPQPSLCLYTNVSQNGWVVHLGGAHSFWGMGETGCRQSYHCAGNESSPTGPHVSEEFSVPLNYPDVRQPCSCDIVKQTYLILCLSWQERT